MDRVRCALCGTPLQTGSVGCLPCLLFVGLEPHPGEGDAPPLPEPASNRRFGHYEIATREDGTAWELGRGAMGITYRASDTVLRCAVALKVINARAAAHPDARERFLREARAAAQLRHPNVASVFHFEARADGQCFYAMELVEGETLEARVRREGTLPASLALEVVAQVARALVAAEARGLVHRDLKPSNLMVAASEGGDPDAMVIKVIDFGLAKAVAVAAQGEMNLSRGGFVGTPIFASPEQFTGTVTNEALDTRLDVFSLGVTFWFLLTARVPFAGNTLAEIHDCQLHRPLPLAQLTFERVPLPVTTLLRTMLATSPAQRPQSARELIAAVRRCREEVERTAPRRRGRLVAGAALWLLLLLAVTSANVAGYLPWRRHPHPSASTALAKADKSIAVLPFDNRSDDKENAFLTDGVQEEILTNLARVADLKVISRTSVMPYKSGGGRNLREIARELGVAHVLEGSVQRMHNRVRVTAQLIDARTDAHLWAQTYDREVADVFDLQSEIAKTIADQLEAKISPRENAAITQAPTTDLLANALYQQALALEGASSGPQNLLEAVRLGDQAVARDPRFVRAYCLLGRLHVGLFYAGYDHTPGRREMAEAAIQTALRLQPEAGEVHLTAARYAYYGFRDYDRARAELDVARRTLTNEADVFYLGALLDRRQGRWSEAVRNAERAVELDPRNAAYLRMAGGIYYGLRRYPEASRLVTRALEIPPRDHDGRVLRAMLPFDGRADLRPLRIELAAILTEEPGAAKKIASAQMSCALNERDSAAAARALAAIPVEGLQWGAFVYPRAWFAGLIARTFNDSDTARASFNIAREIVERSVLAQPDYAQAWSVLGRVDAALGRKAEAIREGRRACELLPLSVDALEGAIFITDLAVIYAWVGEKDLALEQLAISAQTPMGVSYGELKLEPQWDSLRADPRFDTLVKRLSPE